MKCEVPDCAERFNAKIRSEYGIWKYGSNDVFDDDSRVRKVKVCKKCTHRPMRELIEAFLDHPLSEEEIKAMKDSNLILNLEKSMADQF